MGSSRYCILLTAVCSLLVTGAEAQESPGQRQLVNDGVVRLMAGSYESTDLRMAVDLANALDDGYDLRVIPMVGKGSVRNVEDLLYLRGVDIAMVQSDVLDFYRRNDLISNIDGRLRYITKLSNEEVHVLARAEFREIDDLAGRRVSFGLPESGDFMTAGILFDSLGVTVDVVTDPPERAIQLLKTGEIDAMVIVDGAPVDLIKDVGVDAELTLLPLAPSRIGASYAPATLTSDEYPNLIKSYAPIETVAVSDVLAAYNWAEDNERGRPVNHFVERLFAHYEKLLGPSYHPKWRDVDLAEELQGWQRLEAADTAKAQVALATVEYGEYLSLECVACHRATDAAGAIPTIAALPSQYFVNALKSYRDGDRLNLVMQDVAFSLDEEQMQALAAYYQQLRENGQ
ncbi:MAG: TAXI family TRAP transporter solute-binding subunit [Alphaproteobacteria bacterium]